VGCTYDSCDEGRDTVSHAPSDANCNHLDAAPACSAAGRVEEILGRCDAATDCWAETRVVDDCTLDPVTYSCGTGEIRRQDPVCLPGGGTTAPRCGYTDVLHRDCSTSIPSPHPYCDGSAALGSLTWHWGATPLCDDSGSTPACTYADSATRCTAPGPSCSSASLTTYTATCTNPSGCGTTSSTRGCPDSATVCLRTVLVTYAPTCASTSACGSPTETRTTCSRSPSCVGNVYTVWTSTCDATAEDCIDTVARSTDCTAMEDPDSCDPTGLPNVVSETCLCSATSGCGCTTTSTPCRALLAACQPDGFTLRTYSAGCDPSTATCTMSSFDRICRYGCVVVSGGADRCDIG